MSVSVLLKTYSDRHRNMDQKSRTRVERLLQGQVRNDDLSNLFLFARDRCDGRETVKEIGDFVAHHNERVKGIVTQTVRDFFTLMDFHAPGFAGDRTLKSDDLPRSTPDFLRACFGRLDHQTIKKETGINKTSAAKHLDGILRSLQVKPDGRYTLTRASQTEQKLLQCLVSYLVVKPAFVASSLSGDLFATLKSQSLLTKEELRSCHTLNPIIALFAVSIMHNCSIRVSADLIVKLSANQKGDNGVSVQATIPVHIPEKGKIDFVCDIFTTDLDPTAYCSADLLANVSWPSIDLELSQNGKLTIM